MYSVKINKERIKNHLQYDWWKYITGILLTVFLWTMISNMVKPRTPAEEMMNIFFVGDYIGDQDIDFLVDGILEEFSSLKEVVIDRIPLTGDGEMEIYGRQKLVVMLLSQTGDIYIFDKEEFRQTVGQGIFLPLDEFIKDNPDLVDNKGLEKFVLYDEDTGEEKEAHYYGIPLGTIKLYDNIEYDFGDNIISVMNFSKNQSGSLDVIKWFFSELSSK